MRPNYHGIDVLFISQFENQPHSQQQNNKQITDAFAVCFPSAHDFHDRNFCLVLSPEKDQHLSESHLESSTLHSSDQARYNVNNIATFQFPYKKNKHCMKPDFCFKISAEGFENQVKLQLRIV